MQHVFFTTNTNSNNIVFFLYLADSKLISLPVIQLNRPSRLFRKSSSIDKPMCDNSVFHQRNNSRSNINLYLLICLHFLILLIWHYLIRLIFVYPSITLINVTYSKFPWSNIELVNLRKP